MSLSSGLDTTEICQEVFLMMVLTFAGNNTVLRSSSIFICSLKVFNINCLKAPTRIMCFRGKKVDFDIRHCSIEISAFLLAYCVDLS